MDALPSETTCTQFWECHLLENSENLFKVLIKDTYENNEPQMYKDISIEEIINTLKCTHKLRLPEID